MGAGVQGWDIDHIGNCGSCLARNAGPVGTQSYDLDGGGSLGRSRPGSRGLETRFRVMGLGLVGIGR